MFNLTLFYQGKSPGNEVVFNLKKSFIKGKYDSRKFLESDFMGVTVSFDFYTILMLDFFFFSRGVRRGGWTPTREELWVDRHFGFI